MNTDSLRSLYIHELHDAFSAERQILDALPRMAEAARSEGLRDAFMQHRKVTQEHVRRLELILEGLDERSNGLTCKGIRGILEEGEEVLRADDRAARDAALISSAQRVEHYEMAVYGALRSYAEQLGREDDAQLLQQTLDEEGAADQALSGLALSGVNEAAEA